MSVLEMHPEWLGRLRDLGFAGPEDFLRLEGVILGGHPDRHTLRVSLGSESAFLKKEHRVSWRNRLAHWWRGHGFVSKSIREGRMLRRLERAGIACPQVIASGESAGRAFLLVRAETGLCELRRCLQEHPLERMALAEKLGRELARMHAAGFCHRDLYSKHVLVGRNEKGWTFCFLDWQRGKHVRRVNWLARLRDLATLDASLADDLASRRERLLCWQAYLAAQARITLRPQKLLRTLCRLSTRLQRQRRMRELRQPPLRADRQQLVWLDGEALCVTPRFQKMMPTLPAWLDDSAAASRTDGVVVAPAPASARGTWILQRRWARRPWQWLTSWLRRPAFPAPEFEQAAALIRLERFGVETPRLLALGHRKLRPWRKYSFLLTESPAEVVPLLAFLRTAAPAARFQILRHAGQLLRRLHEAGFILRRLDFKPWGIRPSTGEVVLRSVSELVRSKAAPSRLGRRDLGELMRVASPDFSTTDRMRFFLGYNAAKSRDLSAPHLARRLMSRIGLRPTMRRERRVA